MMTLHILFIQRAEDYPGQCAPEALVVWDEFCLEANPEGFKAACDAALAKQGGVIASRVIDVNVDHDAISQALTGTVTIAGEVKP